MKDIKEISSHNQITFMSSNCDWYWCFTYNVHSCDKEKSCCDLVIETRNLDENGIMAVDDKSTFTKNDIEICMQEPEIIAFKEIFNKICDEAIFQKGIILKVGSEESLEP